MDLLAVFHPLWLYHALDWPMNTGPNGGYNFWSGIGSGGPWFATFGLLWHHMNCAEPGCKRIGKAHRGHRCARHAKQ